eukprot:9636635-Alexandrium_andersonii.AAC.1
MRSFQERVAYAPSLRTCGPRGATLGMPAPSLGTAACGTQVLPGAGERGDSPSCTPPPARPPLPSPPPLAPAWPAALLARRADGGDAARGRADTRR